MLMQRRHEEEGTHVDEEEVDFAQQVTFKTLCVGLTGRSAGSTWGPVCSSRCPWSGIVPNRPQRPQQRDQGGLQEERQNHTELRHNHQEDTTENMQQDTE